MPIYMPDDTVLAAYEKVAAQATELIAAAVACLARSDFHLQYRKDFRDDLSRVALEIQRFYSGYKIPADDAPDLSRMEADRRQRTFLDALGTMIAQALREARRRFPKLEPVPSARVEDLSKVASETAPSQDAINALSEFFRRAAEAAEQAGLAKAERDRELQRQFVAMKLRAFSEATRAMPREQHELLFKSLSKLSRAVSAGVRRGPSADLPDRVVVAWRDAEGYHARYSEGGVTIVLDAALAVEGGYSGTLSGRVESSSGSVAFFLRDPALPERAAPLAVEPERAAAMADAFLAKAGVAAELASLRAAVDALGGASVQAPDLASALSRALDDIA
jgi:hypothetical protein